VASNLWTDLEALRRLARSQRVARFVQGIGTTSSRGAPPSGPFPPFPKLPELEIHAMDLTARLATGDFCDFFFLSESELALVMADVSGKGVPAAVLRGVTRSVLRNLASTEASPGETLSRLNRILCEANLGSMFLTLFLGQYRISTGLLRYANAGHPVPFRIGKDGGVGPFGEVTGPILGILDSRVYADREEWLAVGDKLVLLTDGVTEARDQGGNFFAPSRLQACLEAAAASPPDVLCERLGRSVRTFQQDLPQDDATVLVLQRNL
jgi:sigma-B regulation protein RsbU (phosphoserine phosphatase)